MKLFTRSLWLMALVGLALNVAVAMPIGPGPIQLEVSAQSSSGARAPLVACEEGVNAPCILVASQPSDIVGVWKQYLGNPMVRAPDGMAYIRYNADGTYVLADTAEHTAAPYKNYPYGTYTLEGSIITITVSAPGAPPQCVTGRYEMRVMRAGTQPVALFYTPVEDACAGRMADLSHPLIWVAE